MFSRIAASYALALAISAVASDSEVAAQSPSGAPTPRPNVEAHRTAMAPAIDGVLDDDAWAAAAVADGFIQRQPNAGAPATHPTEARILFDDDAVYVAMRMFDPHPDSIAAPLARRDAGGIYSDWAYVMIDSFHDRRTGFVFAVNPRGVQKDYMIYDDASEDISWDPVWEVGTSIDSLGWTAEFRIPLSQLRFHAGGETWGLNLQRRIARTEEWSFWSPSLPDVAGYVSHFGTLSGMTGLRPPRRLEIQPYASSRLTRAPDQPGNPFFRVNEAALQAGVDIKVGLTAGLTLSGTVNPDFGQVEVDPAVVNLGAFETFFPERRPFFVEGADVFRFGEVRSHINLQNREFFYSRRIGRAPQRQLGGGNVVHVDAPDQTTILGAAKVTGRVGDWTVGVLDAVTGRAEARYSTPDGEHLRAGVEPLTNHLAGRARRAYRDGATMVGSMITATHRDLDDDAFRGFLRSSAYVGGLDFEHNWSGRAWTLSGFAAGSRVAGSGDAIALAQRAPARYFHRPDAPHLDYVPERTSLDGHAAALALRHMGRWDMSLRYDETAPGFDVNDLGFQGRSDFRSLTGFFGQRVNRRQGIFRNRSAYLFGGHEQNFGGDVLMNLVGGGANATFTSLWSGGVEGWFQPESYDDRLTRGGPLARRPTQWQAQGWINTDSRRAVVLSLDSNLEGTGEGGYYRSVGIRTDWRPTTATRVRFGPRVVRAHSPRQYVAAFPDEAAEATFGRRYLFADIDQTNLALDTRVDWTFSPRLTLELFAQPFIASGHFDRYKQLREAGGRTFDVFGEDSGNVSRVQENGHSRIEIIPDDGPRIAFADPSFTLRSLRGNAVLRWEYRPGSTVFLIWQQNRSDRLGDGDFRFRRDLSDVFTAPGTNVFLIKATYWIGQ